MDNQEMETSIADQKKNAMNKTQNTFYQLVLQKSLKLVLNIV